MVGVLLISPRFAWRKIKHLITPSAYFQDKCILWLIWEEAWVTHGQCFQLSFFQKLQNHCPIGHFYINWDGRRAINRSSVKTFPWETNPAMLSDELPLYQLRATGLVEHFAYAMHAPVGTLSDNTLIRLVFVCFKSKRNSSSGRGSNLPQIT